MRTAKQLQGPERKQHKLSSFTFPCEARAAGYTVKTVEVVKKVHRKCKRKVIRKCMESVKERKRKAFLTSCRILRARDASFKALAKNGEENVKEYK